MTPELSRPVRVDAVGTAARDMEIEADAHERAALAKRFALASIDSLRAELTLSRRGDLVFAKGRLLAAVVQSCVVTGEPVPARIEESFEIVFQPAPRTAAENEEIELSESEMDVVFYQSGSIDVGEAVAETLSLSLDPYPRTADAEQAIRKAGIKSEAEAAAQAESDRAANSPFAVLKKK